jgi:hypothetical protein
MGLNAVEVDQAALAAEADRILAGAPADLAPAIDPAAPALAGELAPAEPTLEQIQAAAAGYEGGAFLIVSKAADIVVPAWRISADERKALSSSIALALAAWFPDHQLPPKYVALLGVAGSLYAIVDARRDPETGKLLPRHEQPADAAPRPPTEAT